jgi:hypothetical protein
MTSKPINRDTTIEDIHRTRVRMAEKFGDDISAILADAQNRQDASGRVIWQRRGPNQPLQPTGTANSADRDSKSLEAVPAAER